MHMAQNLFTSPSIIQWMRADVGAGPWLYQFMAHYLESCMRCLLTHGDVGKCRRMAWKCSLKCLAHAPIVLVFLLLSLGQGRSPGRVPERMSEVNIKNIFLGSGYWFLNKSTPGQRPNVLTPWLTSPLHLPWSLWTCPTEDKAPVPPAGEGHLQRAVPCALHHSCWILVPLFLLHRTPLCGLCMLDWNCLYSAIATCNSHVILGEKDRENQDALFSHLKKMSSFCQCPWPLAMGRVLVSCCPSFSSLLHSYHLPSPQAPCLPTL